MGMSMSGMGGNGRSRRMNGGTTGRKRNTRRAGGRASSRSGGRRRSSGAGMGAGGGMGMGMGEMEGEPEPEARRSGGRTRTRRGTGGARRYGRKAGDKVERAMHEKKRGTLRSGRSGKKVTSRKQAIAIGLSEARRAGAKVPRRSGGSKRK
jgi:hypothetical protein